MTREIDICIIGQGLAGTTLAWALHQQGQKVVIIDQEKPSTSSRIAAGLITPVTGQRFVKSWKFDEFWTTAEKFYQTIEDKTNSNFFIRRNSIRLFTSIDEQEIFKQKADRDFPELVNFLESPLNKLNFDNSTGGFEMTQAARLNVPMYLDISKEYFSQLNGLITAEFDLEKGLKLETGSIILKQFSIRTKRVIFCQGFLKAENPWFNSVRFDAAKGEILTVKIPGLNEKRVIHRGIWLSSIGEDFYRVGATYDRENLDSLPTDTGCEELCSRLKVLIKLPFKVIDHQAAVRPIISGRKPLVGMHPEFPCLGYFNGLGSKGSLQAPWFANLFAETITNNAEIPPELDIACHMKRQKQGNT